MFNLDPIVSSEKMCGITPVRVMAVNPSGKWLHTNKFRKEDVDVDYKFDFDGVTGTSVNIYLQSLLNNKNQYNVKFNIYSKGVSSKKDIPMWVDSFGKSSYASTKEEAKFLDHATAIHGCAGLADLVKFIRTWLRAEFDAPLSLDLNKLLKGDVSEIVNLVKISNDLIAKGSEVGLQVMVGVADNGYEAVFSKSFVRLGDTNYSYLMKALTSSYEPDRFKANYMGDIKLQVYKPSTAIAVDTPDAIPGGAAAIGASLPVTADDLPF